LHKTGIPNWSTNNSYNTPFSLAVNDYYKFLRKNKLRILLFLFALSTNTFESNTLNSISIDSGCGTVPTLIAIETTLLKQNNKIRPICH